MIKTKDVLQIVENELTRNTESIIDISVSVERAMPKEFMIFSSSGEFETYSKIIIIKRFVGRQAATVGGK